MIVTTLRTKVLHVFSCFLVVLEVLCGTCSGGNLIRREQSEQTLLDFSVSVLRLFTMCAVKRCKHYNTKLDHAKLLSLSILRRGAVIEWLK